MIQAIETTNYRNEKLRLELSNPWDIGMAVIGVDGLGPVECDINTTDYSVLVDGSLFNSARAQSRNIVMTLQFLDNYKSIEEVRHDTYQFFPLKKKLRFVVETDFRICETEGWVESNTPSIFDKSEGCQISIICTRSWFYDVTRKAEIKLQAIANGFKFKFANNINPANQFQFRFANRSLTQNELQFYDSNIDNHIKFGEIDRSQQKTLTYNGEVETGVTISIITKRDCKNPVIKNMATDEHMRVNTEMLKKLTGNGFMADDEIIINTEQGSKSIKLIRDADEYNILNCLNPNSDWIKVIQGDNLFVYDADEGVEDLEITVTAKITYQGV